MKGRFNTDLKGRVVKRYSILGKSFATETLAFRALAKKEIAVYAASKALPAARIAGDLGDKDNAGRALMWLFEEEWFGEGSRYREWIKARAARLAVGAAPLIRESEHEIYKDCFAPCWEVGFDLANPWPKEDYVLRLLANASAEPVKPPPSGEYDPFKDEVFV